LPGKVFLLQLLVSTVSIILSFEALLENFRQKRIKNSPPACSVHTYVQKKIKENKEHFGHFKLNVNIDSPSASTSNNAQASAGYCHSTASKYLHQGDQIERICVHWTTAYILWFFCENCRSRPQLVLLFPL
jgi:hypothetical protein